MYHRKLTSQTWCKWLNNKLVESWLCHSRITPRILKAHFIINIIVDILAIFERDHKTSQWDFQLPGEIESSPNFSLWYLSPREENSKSAGRFLEKNLHLDKYGGPISLPLKVTGSHTGVVHPWKTRQALGIKHRKFFGDSCQSRLKRCQALPVT
jgi:hypothetical protein